MAWSRAALVLASLLLAGCSATDPEPSATPTGTPSPTATCEPAEVVADWPLDKQLRQLLFGGVYTGNADALATAEEAAAAGIGGLNFLGNDAQIYAQGQLGQVRAAAPEIQPFLAVDQEGGRVQRLRPIIGPQPSARTMGATMTPEQVQELAFQTGTAMQSLSLDMDLAPVADVSSAADNTVIGDRAFSADPAVVATYAGAFAAGLRQAEVIPVLKHFPGLGSATGNTDFEPATVPPLAQLRAVDLLPYESLLAVEPVAVMMATAVVPDLTNGQQAGLSPEAIDLLRTEFNFTGVVMTDSLSGQAVSSQYTLPEAAELALIAGVDMVLWDTTAEVEEVVARLSDAVQTGRLPVERVNESVLRVLTLKQVDPCELSGLGRPNE